MLRGQYTCDTAVLTVLTLVWRCVDETMCVCVGQHVPLTMAQRQHVVCTHAHVRACVYVCVCVSKRANPPVLTLCSGR